VQEFFKEKEKQEKHFQALEAAIASIRKTECWGKNNFALNFEWPTKQELLEMLKSSLNIKVADLKYKIKSNNNARFGAFQLILSNGKSSPVFTSDG
jgi:hypothetical protein